MHVSIQTQYLNYEKSLKCIHEACIYYIDLKTKNNRAIDTIGKKYSIIKRSRKVLLRPLSILYYNKNIMKEKQFKHS